MARLRATFRHHYRVLPALLAAAVALHALPAGACSYALRAIDVSYPEPEAIEVPTNVVLFVYGHNLDPEMLRLVDAGGAEVPVQVESVEPSGFDVRPLEALEPRRQYQLHAAAPLYATSDVVPFTTSSGPAALPERMEVPELAVAVLQPPYGPCGDQHSLCVDGSAPPGTSLEVRVGENMLKRYLSEQPSRWFGVFGLNVGPDDCVDVRLRDVRGRRSAPRTVCGADALRVEIAPDERVDYTCENYSALLTERDRQASSDASDLDETPYTPAPVSSSAASDVAEPRDVTFADASERTASGGCQLSASASGSGAGVLGLGLLALLSARRRRARR
jgi:hypothetical protein